MSDLLAQFIDEARELVDSAAKALLQLETTPDDRAALNDLFRSVHTIKGGAGIFEMAPLTRVVHAAEDLLDLLRTGELDLTGEITDLLLETLDDVVGWLDDMAAQGALRPEADATSAALTAALRQVIPLRADEGDDDPDLPPDLTAPPEWLPDPAVCGAQGWAIEFRPEPDCFFGGDDPLLLALSVPDRVWLAIEPVADWGAQATFDPFRCNLVFRLVSTAAREVLEDHFLYVRSLCRFAPVARAAARIPDDLIAAAQEILAAQVEAMATPSAPGLFEARLDSTLALVCPVLTGAGLGAWVAPLTAAADTARQQGDLAPLVPVLTAAAAALDAPPAAAAAPRSAKPEPIAVQPKKTNVIKVELEHVDQLMKLVGELVVAKNALPFLMKRAEDVYGSRSMAREVKAEYEAINRIVEELQGAVMQIRMVPVSGVFQRFQRLIRDLGRKLDKQIELKIEGEETRADKNIVEELAEPLVHLVRNACDHGIETPAERRAAGKPEQGTLTLAAAQVDDRVVIEIRDDGRGIDLDRVRAKAVEKGLISAEAAAVLSEAETARLILLPGFSTVEQISDLSGRGVGMDVVNTMVTRSGGTLAVSSRLGQGATVSISLPQSMAVRQVMMVDVDGGVYGVAIDNVVATIRLPATAVHRLKAEETVVLRNRLIPLRRLRRVFDLDPLPADRDLAILVARTQGGEVGLVVDDFRSEADVIIEPLDEALNRYRYFTGTASLGDGTILLTLNLAELV